MSFSSDSFEQMESLLTCSICLETLNEPCTLPCFHSFCKTCLARFVKKQREKALQDNKEVEEFLCPSCRSVFILKMNEEVAGINSSHFIRNMLDVVTMHKVIKCSSCEAKSVVWRCVTCEFTMCETCSNNHDKNHQLVSTSEVSTSTDHGPNQDKLQIKPRCTQHDRPLKFYCEECKELVCKSCRDLCHTKKEHCCRSVEDVAKEKRMKLKSSSDILDYKLNKGNQALQAVSDDKQRLEDNFEKAKGRLNRQKQEILESFVRSLDQRAQKMMDELDEEYSKVHEPLVQQNEELKLYCERVKVTSEFTKNLLKRGDYEEIISSQEVIEQKVEKMEKDQPKPMKPVHHGDFQYRCKEWKDTDFRAILSDIGNVACDSLSGLLYNASDILNKEEKFVDQMEEWLDDLCKWRLCYRATKDGWSAQDFHACCDDKGPTVMLVKVGDNVFGGFTDQSWGGSGYKESTSSFLFSLRNNDDLLPFKAPIFQHYKNATWHNPNYGPSFGYGFVGCDLYISNNPHISSQSYTNFGYMYKPPEGYTYKDDKTYALFAGAYYFQPTEIEVFF